MCVTCLMCVFHVREGWEQAGAWGNETKFLRAVAAIGHVVRDSYAKTHAGQTCGVCFGCVF
jgi:hypothetical protein